MILPCFSRGKYPGFGEFSVFFHFFALLITAVFSSFGFSEKFRPPPPPF